MNRRGFLASILGAAIADPDLLNWVPGRKTISIPKSERLQEMMSTRIISRLNPQSGLYETRIDILYGIAIIKPGMTISNRMLG